MGLLEGESWKAISWGSGKVESSWHFFYILNEIERLTEATNASFYHVPRRINEEVYSLVELDIEGESYGCICPSYLSSCILFVYRGIVHHFDENLSFYIILPS